MAVLLALPAALVEALPRRRGAGSSGRGDEAELAEAGRTAREHLRFLGQVDDAEKASAMRSADVYCAPNTGGESFGIVLVEAMAAGTRRWWPATSMRSAGCSRTARPGRLVPVDDADGAGGGAGRACWGDDALRGALRRPRRRGGAAL